MPLGATFLLFHSLPLIITTGLLSELLRWQ